MQWLPGTRTFGSTRPLRTQAYLLPTLAHTVGVPAGYGGTVAVGTADVAAFRLFG